MADTLPELRCPVCIDPIVFNPNGPSKPILICEGSSDRPCNWGYHPQCVSELPEGMCANYGCGSKHFKTVVSHAQLSSLEAKVQQQTTLPQTTTSQLPATSEEVGKSLDRVVEVYTKLQNEFSEHVSEGDLRVRATTIVFGQELENNVYRDVFGSKDYPNNRSEDTYGWWNKQCYFLQLTEQSAPASSCTFEQNRCGYADGYGFAGVISSFAGLIVLGSYFPPTTALLGLLYSCTFVAGVAAARAKGYNNKNALRKDEDAAKAWDATREERLKALKNEFAPRISSIVKRHHAKKQLQTIDINKLTQGDQK